MLRPGDKAPDFTLPDHNGNDVSLKQLIASGPAILFFYPADFTPICTREACLFRDGYAELANAGVAVAGISTDASDTHTRFRDKHELPYPLLADADKSAIRAFGVEGPLGIGTRRATFLIDGDGTILEAVRADLRLRPHEKLLQAALSATTGS